MREIRLARKGEIRRQREIWQLCFGDDDKYIDLYFARRYKEDETVLLLEDGEIAAMLRILPVKMTRPDQGSINSAMLYAIATHPQFQNRGLAGELMGFTHQYLLENNITLSLLVPAGKQLVGFYGRQGYREGFYIREARLSRRNQVGLAGCQSGQGLISPISPAEYNRRRNRLCSTRNFIEYSQEDIAYQKDLARLSGADIYGVDIAGVQGCAAIESITPLQIVIKEILLPDCYLEAAVEQIARLLDARELVVRTPADKGQVLGGQVRSFGMYKALNEAVSELVSGDAGFLGLAFD